MLPIIVGAELEVYLLHDKKFYPRLVNLKNSVIICRFEDIFVTKTKLCY